MFNLIISLIYVLLILYLIMEAHEVSAEKRKELQTVPLVLAVTMLYGVVLWKAGTLLNDFWAP